MGRWNHDPAGYEAVLEERARRWALQDETLANTPSVVVYTSRWKANASRRERQRFARERADGIARCSRKPVNVDALARDLERHSRRVALRPPKAGIVVVRFDTRRSGRAPRSARRECSGTSPPADDGDPDPAHLLRRAA